MHFHCANNKLSVREHYIQFALTGILSALFTSILKCLFFTRDFIIFDAFWSIDSILKGHGLVSIERANPQRCTDLFLSPTHSQSCLESTCFAPHISALFGEIKGWISQRRRPTLWPRGQLSTSNSYWECLVCVWPFNSCGHFTSQLWCFSNCVLHSEWWMWMAFAAHFTSAMQYINKLHYLCKVNCVLIRQTFCYLGEHTLMTH